MTVGPKHRRSRSRVLLTGASRGIGRATAELLIANGWEVWGTARRVDRLPALPSFHPVEMDLCDSGSIERGFLAAESEAGEFDALINNAGDGVFGPAEHTPAAAMREQFEMHYFGPLELTRRILPRMRTRGAGVIVNVTSLAARFPVPFMSGYSAAKAALGGFSAALALELTGTGVSVVDLQPGDIHTEFHGVMRRIEPGDYGAAMARVEKVLERDCSAGPPPALVARAILRELNRPTPRRTVGGFLQSKAAPLAARVLPWRAMLWLLRRYFGIDQH
ncbi:MAG: SDR family NAD(P)-dependent oxidoreductase [Chthoniobacteraceae bacterium]